MPSILLVVVFRVVFTKEIAYSEGDQTTPVCVETMGIIVRDDVIATISSLAVGTATGELDISGYGLKDCSYVSVERLPIHVSSEYVEPMFLSCTESHFVYINPEIQSGIIL